MAAPGHSPEYVYRRNSAIKEAIDKLAAMMQAGQGTQPFSGGDDNQSSSIKRSATAAVYLSWMSSRGVASMPVQAPLLPASIPLMLIIGTKYPSYGTARA